MEKVNKAIKKFQRSYRSLPDKKQYIEFFTAALTVPMLLTVIIINLNNLKNTNKTSQPTPTPAQERPIILNIPTSADKITTTLPTPSTAACNQAIGPISIDYPDENDVITDNPVQININYVQGNYCSVVWAYRINDGSFSEYDDKSIALYNPPQGAIHFQLKVKSIVTGQQTVLTRDFTYNGTSATVTPTASNSAH